MKDHHFLMDAMDQIDDDLIEEARSIRPRHHWKPWAAAAAVLAIICSVSIALAHFVPDIVSPTQPSQTIFTPQNVLRDPSPTQYPSVSTPPEVPPAPVTPPPTPGPPLITSLYAPGFEQGLVGSSSSSTGTGSNAEVRTLYISVTAKAVEMLPDTYHIIGESTNRFRLVRMEIIRTLRGQCPVDSFYYILPEAYATDLTKYDALVIPLVRQFGHINYILYNDTTQELQAMDLIVLGYYSYLCGEITAFTDGNIDTSLWTSTESWAEDFGDNDVNPECSTLEAYEQRVLEHYGTGYSDDVIVPTIKPENDQVADALKYVKPFENGVFIPQELQNSNDWASYRRYINGYPTNERVYIDSDNANYSMYQFTDEDIQNLPDLAAGLQRVNNAYDDGQITPPHLKGWEDMRFIRYEVFGWYAKNDSGIYGVIRVSWMYADDTKKYQDDWFHYDDQYYLVENGSSDCQPIAYSDLTALLGKYATFVIQTEGYDDGGRIIAKLYETPCT